MADNVIGLERSNDSTRRLRVLTDIEWNLAHGYVLAALGTVRDEIKRSTPTTIVTEE